MYRKFVRRTRLEINRTWTPCDTIPTLAVPVCPTPAPPLGGGRFCGGARVVRRDARHALTGHPVSHVSTPLPCGVCRRTVRVPRGGSASCPRTDGAPHRDGSARAHARVRPGARRVLRTDRDPISPDRGALGRPAQRPGGFHLLAPRSVVVGRAARATRQHGGRRTADRPHAAGRPRRPTASRADGRRAALRPCSRSRDRGSRPRVRAADGAAHPPGADLTARDCGARRARDTADRTAGERGPDRRRAPHRRGWRSRSNRSRRAGPRADVDRPGSRPARCGGRWRLGRGPSPEPSACRRCGHRPGARTARRRTGRARTNDATASRAATTPCSGGSGAGRTGSGRRGSSRLRERRRVRRRNRLQRGGALRRRRLCNRRPSDRR